MKVKIIIIFILILLFLGTWSKPVFALVHSQKDGLFSLDIPQEWRWFENSQEIIVTYPDGKTMAMDIQFVPSIKLSQPDIKKKLKEADDKMIKDGVKAHGGAIIDDKEISIDGVYATRLDFQTAPSSLIHVAYISFFNKGYAFTITYGSQDDKMISVMDDAVATIKFR